MPAEGLESPGTGVTGDCEIPCLSSESIQAAGEEQSLLSTAELFFSTVLQLVFNYRNVATIGLLPGIISF